MKNCSAFRVSRLTAACSALVFALSTASAATINVSDNTSLSNALASVNPGDTIVLANGTYSGFTVSHDGTSTAPITIQAANQGQATVSSGIIHLASTSYVTLQGLNITSNGGTQTIDGTSRIVVVWFEVADHCQLTRCTVHPSAPAQYTQFVFLSGASNANRVDHNEFGPNTVHGCHMVWPCGNSTIPGVTPPSDRTSWAEGFGPYNPNMARNTRIDHNYFHDQAAGTAETIVTGAFGTTGDYQDANTLIEYNLFVNCDGDPEIVSVKSSSNTIRYNTVLTSGGQFSLRAGNNSFVYGNFVKAGGKSGSGGVKVYEKNHTVFNNYIENTDQYPILIGAGDSYTSSTFAHAQVFNAWIINNTVVAAGNRPVIMGHGSTDNLPPTNVVFANNIIQGSASQLYDERIAPAGSSVYSANIVWSSGTGVPSTGFTVTDPKLTTVNNLSKLSSTSPAIGLANTSYAAFLDDDMDGQARDSDPDTGADEFSSAPTTRVPLTTADVGPNGPADPVAVTSTLLEAESLPVTTNGPTTSTANDANASGGVWLALNATAVGDYADFTTPSIAAGTYQIKFKYKTNTARGQLSFKVDSTQIGGTIDEYATTATYPEVVVGTVTFNSTGTHHIRLTVTGKNASSSAYTLVADRFTFAPMTQTVSFEAESQTRTSVGASLTNTSDTNASGGVWVSLNSNAPEQYVEFVTPNIPAGTYQVNFRYKTNTTRGQLSVKVDGVVIGSTIDQYASTSSYPTTNAGTVTFTTGGVHLIRLTVLGKNSSSSNYILSADSFSFVGQ
jgi:poly(beta-D-mannuronate) lyase